jgi:hypothetical protein
MKKKVFDLNPEAQHQIREHPKQFVQDLTQKLIRDNNKAVSLEKKQSRNNTWKHTGVRVKNTYSNTSMAKSVESTRSLKNAVGRT